MTLGQLRFVEYSLMVGCFAGWSVAMGPGIISTALGACTGVSLVLVIRALVKDKLEP